MDIRHLFDNADEKTIDRITEKYPPLSSADKERLYAMSKKKYNKEMTENTGNYIEVSGVERYRKPVWQKMISVAAVAVVAIGAVCGGIALNRNGADTDFSESNVELLSEKEIEGIAQQLTDEFFDLKNIISSRGAAYDENDTLTYKIGIFDDTLENPEQYTYERIFYKVTDERFKCSQDIYNALKNITSSTYLPEEKYEKATIPWEYSWDYENEKEKNLDLFCNLGTDVSMFENGCEVGREYFFDAEGNPIEDFPIDFEDDIDWEAPRSIWMADYIEHSASLYMLTPDCVYDPVGVVYDYNDVIEITDITSDSFTVVRYADISQNENIIKRAEFKFVLENGKWCIDNFFECVLDTEGVGSEETDYNVIAQQLSDKFLEFENIINYGNVSYDENDSISFTVINSEDMEWTEKHGNVATFHKVTDPRFTCRQDVYNEVRSFFSSYCYSKDYFYMQNFLGYTIDCYLGNDLSKYENGGTIDLAVNGHNDMEHIYLFCFCEYNGELYVRQHYSELSEYTSDVIIKETGENSFTATRSYTEHYTEDITSERCFDFVLEAGKWKIDNVYVSDEESENESEDEYDYTAIATQLSDKFLEFDNLINCGDVSYDENQSIEFYLYDSNSPESTDNMSKISFNKVTDERFTCRQDIYDKLRKIFSDSYYPDDNMKNAMWVDNSYLISYLGDDFSMYENGGKIDVAENFDNDDVIFVYGTFCDYNGELYVRFDDERHDISEIISKYTTDIVITDIGDNHFTAKRCVSRFGWDKAYGTELIFDFVLENGEWVIENYKEGMDVERSAAMVLEQYLRDSYSYDNVMLNADDMRIQDDFYYELDLQFCRIHVILLDYNGVETLDVEASIALDENRVLSANITELN